jgi:hypothetical protein
MLGEREREREKERERERKRKRERVKMGDCGVCVCICVCVYSVASPFFVRLLVLSKCEAGCHFLALVGSIKVSFIFALPTFSIHSFNDKKKLFPSKNLFLKKNLFSPFSVSLWLDSNPESKN